MDADQYSAIVEADVCIEEGKLVKLACCESLVPGKSLKEKVYNLEEYGYQGIELGGRDVRERLAEIQQVLAESPIKVSALLGQLGGALLSPNKDERDRILRIVKDRLDVAKDIGASGVILVPIFGPPQMPNLEPYMSPVEIEKALLLRLLEDIASHAERVGVMVFLEPLNRYETHFLNRLEQARAICEEMRSSKIRFLADVFHMNLEEVSIAQSIRENREFLGHVHLADSTRFVPGLGNLDFKPIFEALNDIGYDGWCSLECRIRDDASSELIMAREHLGKAGGIFTW